MTVRDLGEGRQLLTFDTKSGKDIRALFKRPAKEGAVPGILYLTGWGRDNHAFTETGRQTADAFVEQGFAVLIMNYPGHGVGEQRSPDDILENTRMDIYQEAALRAHEVLANRRDVDSANIFYYGPSVGGAVVLCSLSDRVRAAAVRSPILSVADNDPLIDYLLQEYKCGKRTRPFETYIDNVLPEVTGYPSYIVKRAVHNSVPTLYLMGTHDEFTPLLKQIPLAEQLGIPVDAIIAMHAQIKNLQDKQVYSPDLEALMAIPELQLCVLERGVVQFSSGTTAMLYYLGANHGVDNDVSCKKNYYAHMVKMVPFFFKNYLPEAQ